MEVIACLESTLSAILNSQREIGDEVVSIIVTRIFWYWDFENRSLRVDGKIGACELMEKSIGVEIIIVTGSTNGGAEGTRGCRDWRWCCGLENSEW